MGQERAETVNANLLAHLAVQVDWRGIQLVKLPKRFKIHLPYFLCYDG
jgi:hypothetical protein